MTVPSNPKIYHIVHCDRLPSIISDGNLWCDAEVRQRSSHGTSIGMESIKQRRLVNPLACHRNLRVGDCTPFYFCPRSVMLYVIHRSNLEGLAYRAGQEPIVHLVADLRETVDWAESENLRWAFTLSNAGARYFEDRCRLENLSDINLQAVRAKYWSGDDIDPLVRDHKQAEFLVERHVPWTLISHIGVMTAGVLRDVTAKINRSDHRPCVQIQRDWYY